MSLEGLFQPFFERRGGGEGNGDASGNRYDFSGFRVADFLGGAADAAEGAEATQGDRLFCCERVGDGFQEGPENPLAFNVWKAKGFGEGAGEVGLRQRLLGLLADVVFNRFGKFAQVRRGFSEYFPDDVVPGEVLFADVFVQGGLGVFVQNRGAASGFRGGDRIGQDGGDGFIKGVEEFIDGAL
jgi:hypothetical protein